MSDGFGACALRVFGQSAGMGEGVDIGLFQVGPDPGDDSEVEGPELAELARQARAYVDAHGWGSKVRDVLLAYGLGGVIGLFLVRFSEPIEWHGYSDRELWVVTGDMPPAYFATDDIPTPDEALQFYCELMEDWANSVLAGADVSRTFPIAAEPTAEHAWMLKRRIEFIREKVIPRANRFSAANDVRPRRS